jgi:hypothetical protein
MPRSALETCTPRFGPSCRTVVPEVSALTSPGNFSELSSRADCWQRMSGFSVLNSRGFNTVAPALASRGCAVLVIDVQV